MSIPSSAHIVAFHDRCIQTPDADDAVVWDPMEHPIGREIALNHQSNMRLWAEEDLARRRLAADSEIAANKRSIDRYNQTRNDAIERMDMLLLQALNLTDEHTQAEQRRLNSETAGSMIDRLSILALKIAAMRDQSRRTDVGDAFRQDVLRKLARLTDQRNDLSRCYDTLIDECRTGTALFRIYRQFKMYNDPALNPALVAEMKGSAT